MGDFFMNRQQIINQLELSGLSYSEQQPFVNGVRTIFVDSIKTGVAYQVRISGTRMQISFRGTDSFKDIITDLRFMKTVMPYDNSSSKIRVHKGFITAYKSADVRDKIQSLIHSDIKEIKITGHSYGAALALLCAVDLQYNFPDRDFETVVFGCPRVGNSFFKKSFDKRLFKTVRVENGNDAVTKVPYAFLGYRHVGAKMHIGSPGVYGIISFKDHSASAYYGELLAGD